MILHFATYLAFIVSTYLCLEYQITRLFVSLQKKRVAYPLESKLFTTYIV